MRMSAADGKTSPPDIFAKKVASCYLEHKNMHRMTETPANIEKQIGINYLLRSTWMPGGSLRKAGLTES